MSIFQPTTWGWLQRAVAQIMTKMDKPDHGADSAADYATGPGFDQLHSMAAMSRFAFVYAAATRRAADMASLPLKLYVGCPERDPDAYELSDHPLLDLMEMPNSEDTGEELRRQAAVDLMLPGNSYLLKVGGSLDVPPTSLLRWHPEDVRIVPNRHGKQIKAYALDLGDSEQLVDPGLVLHTRGPSWQRGPQSLYGQGNIEALQDELTTQLRARDHQMKLAGRGRPDVVLSPADDGETWSQKDREAIKEAWAKMSSGGGPLIMGGSAKAEFLNLTPRDMEYEGLDNRIISAIMASMQTPPIILGRETANYATARQQDAVYWRGIAHDARLFDARWSVGLARMWGRVNGKYLYIRHDFSAVLPLQAERTAQVDRAHKHIAAGAAPSEAYAYEGLAGAPVSDEPLDLFSSETLSDVDESDVEALPMPSEPAEPKGQLAAPTHKADGAWNDWLIKIHDPSEKRMNEAASQYLNGARKRYAERLQSVISETGRVQLSVVGSNGVILQRGLDVEAIVDALQEEEEALKILSPVWKRVWMLAATNAASELPLEGINFDPNQKSVVTLIQKFVADITTTQAAAVRTIVEDGLADGLSIGAMQEQLMQSAAFGRARARRIARTETTRAVNKGTINAYQEASALGLEVKKVWLTASTDARPSHAEMNGQERDLDEDFISGDGNSAEYPGGFGIAEEDINCRCTTVPKVVGGDPVI